MTGPIALGRSSVPPSPPGQMQWGDSALTAPVTPERRVRVIDRNKVNPEIRRAAEGMEAMFLGYMMEAMRKTVPKNEMDLESPASKIYQGMMDTETAEKAARTGGIGLADLVIAYLESQSYTQGKGQAGPSQTDATRRTGGTHEGQSNNN